jgi:hypothetical protein
VREKQDIKLGPLSSKNKKKITTKQICSTGIFSCQSDKKEGKKKKSSIIFTPSPDFHIQIDSL